MDSFVNLLTSGQMASFDVARGGLGPLTEATVMFVILVVNKWLVH